MATKVITVCDWHEEDVEAPHHNEWVNPQGQRRRNDLCDADQKKFLKAWEAVERASTSVEVPTTRPTRKKATSKAAGPTQSAIIKAWAKREGMEVAGGRVPFHIEQAWKEAGSPNLLEG